MQNNDTEIAKLWQAVNRLIADAESEKEVRRDRNRDIDEQLQILHDDKLIRDTTIKNAVLVFKILATLNMGAIIMLVIMAIKFLKS